MAGDGVEVDAKIRDIHRHVHRALRAVHQHRHVPRTGLDRLHVDDGPEDVGALRHRDQLGPLGHGREHLIRRDRPVRVGIDPNEPDPLPFAQEMPRDDVGVMLGHGQDDLVALDHARRGPAIGDHVDALGRAGVEHDLILGRRVQKAGDDAAHRFVFLGGEVRKIVQTAMDVGVFLGIAARHRVDHHLRLLGRSPVVEIGQRLAVHLTREDREIRADLVHIIHYQVLPRSWPRRPRGSLG